MDVTVTFTLNGRPRTVTVDPERSLLEVLREDLQLTGTKYGCGEGQCAACTVLIDGKPTLSCVTRAAGVAGKDVLTIEGLAASDVRANKESSSVRAPGDKLHPVQEAFLAEGAFQCGYCTPGMVLATVALLRQTPNPTDEQVLTALNRHLCRCCEYPKVLKAVRRAAGAGTGAP